MLRFSMLIFVMLTGFASKMKIEFLNCPPIPPRTGTNQQFGLAGPVAGAVGDHVIVAGGANFENGMPWNSGAKSYHDDIYLLSQKPDGTLSWKVSETKLPFPIAYSACITMKDGFISMGGENSDGPLKAVFKYSLKKDQIVVDKLPDLPLELTAAGGAIIGNTIFVAGGMSKAGESNAFYSLSLKNPQEGWKRLPDLPVKLAYSVCVAQNDGKGDAIFVVGGRCKTGDLSTIYSTVYKYSLVEKRWSLEGDIKIGNEILRSSAGTGFALGRDKIVLFSGDRGILFNRTEQYNNDIAREADPEKRNILTKNKIEFLENHPGFSNQILEYNVISKSWSGIGEIPGKAPVTTVVFKWKGKFVIPSGEIRPGVRTDKVFVFLVK